MLWAMPTKIPRWGREINMDSREREKKDGFPYTGVRSSKEGEVFLSKSDREQLDRIEMLLEKVLSVLNEESDER
jgi:hypothetical protein